MGPAASKERAFSEHHSCSNSADIPKERDLPGRVAKYYTAGLTQHNNSTIQHCYSAQVVFYPSKSASLDISRFGGKGHTQTSSCLRFSRDHYYAKSKHLQPCRLDPGGRAQTPLNCLIGLCLQVELRVRPGWIERAGLGGVS